MEASKLADWVDQVKLDNPKDVKPEDRDDEMDGEWEPPTMDNPEYNAKTARLASTCGRSSLAPSSTT